MSIIDDARYLRSVIEQLSVNLDDEQAVEAVELFPAWRVGTEYKIGDRVRYSDVLYKVLQDHTSQANWTPDPEVIPVWEQPSAGNAYMTGDKVYYPTAEDDVSNLQLITMFGVLPIIRKVGRSSYRASKG